MRGFSRIVELTTQGRPFCVATVIVSDNPDIPVGTKAIVLEDGTIDEGFGSTHLDELLKAHALEALAEAKKRTVFLTPGVQAFLDIFSTDVRLLICGAGHIALPLARFAREVGFRVTVLDDRLDFAHPSRFPHCEVIAENFVTALHNMPLGPNHFVVVITRGHEHDVECLEKILPKETAYVGLIGSRRRVGFVIELLSRKGISQTRLKEVFTPIGLPLGAESPAEIALSITAELVCVRRKGARQARSIRAAPGGIE